MATGFASDDYGWLRLGIRGQLGWDASFRFAGHTNALPFEIALYHLKYALFGFNVVGYHLFSLAGHIANLLLVYLLARRLGASVRVASLASVLASVFTAGSQAVYWMSGDPHLFAGMLALASVILYIDHREKGGWWRYAFSLALAIAAPLVKAEGVSVVAGVLAYDLIWRRPRSWTWKAAPFVLAPLPFVIWEWTTSDQLQTKRGLGLNVVESVIGYGRQFLLPVDPLTFIHSAGSTLHRILYTGIGLALLVEGAAIAVLFVIGLTRRQSLMLLVFGAVGTAPALVVTLGTQSRYIYFASLLAMPILAIGAWVAFRWAWNRFSHSALQPITIVVLAVVISGQAWMTSYESGALRAAHNESLAFRAAVLKDHQAFPDGTPICIMNTPLDVGTATAVFADPRLAPGVGIPTVSRCDSLQQAAPGMWVYERQPDGTYVSLQ